MNTEDLRRISKTGHRGLYVNTLDNDQLWERAHDPEEGIIVRVNSSHRFCRDILNAVSDNNDLLKVTDVLFYSIVRGEFDLVYKSEQNDDKIEEIMAEYRERVGETLSDVIRRLNLTDFLVDV